MAEAKWALISVSDKSGVAAFARGLVERFGYGLLSTGGTARLLREEGLPVREVSEHTGFPEMMEGRLKTLHPRVHGGLLADRSKPEHVLAAAGEGIEMIDLLVVNLYPFEATVAKPGATLAEAIENIDIGGPAMLRSAAKNHASVTVVCDPGDYPRVLEALGGSPDELARLRKKLARKVYARTSAYDGAIAAFLEREAEAPEGVLGLPEKLALAAPREKVLRYGENPHQQGALYGKFFELFEQLQGKELSYCNILDISAAAGLIGEFQRPTLAILKHTNPCGVGSAERLEDAWELAYETDKTAPFGGIIVVNQVVTEELAEKISEIWCEIILAPAYTEGALGRFKKKKNLRLMVAKGSPGAEALLEVRTILGGYLVQDRDRRLVRDDELRVVTVRQPTEEEWGAMRFGWRVVKHVKSNAIVYTTGERTLGIGAGQMSRVDSSKLAVRKATEAGLSLEGSAMCSDALLPFADGLVAAADAGARCCIQTGGSVRDEEVIAAANERGLAMVFTGMRHFRH